MAARYGFREFIVFNLLTTRRLRCKKGEMLKLYSQLRRLYTLQP